MQDRHLPIAQAGRGFQKPVGYRWRALVTADLSRFERIICDGCDHTEPRRATEIAIALERDDFGLNRERDSRIG